MNETNDYEFKEYTNERILNLIKSKIPEGTYGEYTDLVYEIVMRRFYTFDLTEEELSHSIDNLLKNCKTIQISRNFQSKSVLAHINTHTKLVEINASNFENSFDYEIMYESLTHEIYHAMSEVTTYEKRDAAGLEFFHNGIIYGITLNEVFNEYAADMASYSRTRIDEQRCYHRTNGYTGETFTVPLLATALGVTEKELLKHRNY